MDVLLPCVAALVAVLILPGWSFYFDVIPKIAVLLAATAIVLWTARRKPASPTRPLKIFFAVLAAQAAAILLATAFSTHRWFSLYGSTWRRDGIFAELAVLIFAAAAASALATDPSRLRLWLRITALTAGPVAIYAILQYFGIDPLLAPSGYQFGEGKFMIVRPPATLGHASYLATYLLYAVFAGAALVRKEMGIWRNAAVATMVLALFALVLSGTRAAVVGLIAGVVFVAAREHINRRWVFAAAAIVAVLAAFYISPAGERLRARVFWSSEDMLGGSRLLLWRDTLWMSTQRWIAGYGPETFALEFPRHQSLELARKYPDFYHESPHNIFIDALVSKGVL
jgi:O-antigen ligase